jgi:hypothetical protein
VWSVIHHPVSSSEGKNKKLKFVKYQWKILWTVKQLPNHSLFSAGAEITENEIQKELKRKQDGCAAI